jgi:hypothetical protein
MLGAVLKTYFDIVLQQKFEFGRQSGSAGDVIVLAFHIVLLYQDYFDLVLLWNYNFFVLFCNS